MENSNIFSNVTVLSFEEMISIKGGNAGPGEKAGDSTSIDQPDLT
ncbi:MAG TPA: hypothetical protein P5550_03465 [Bacteroidales bacterium]|nr:hypothetical protein [Bacteroidales bacterium]